MHRRGPNRSLPGDPADPTLTPAVLRGSGEDRAASRGNENLGVDGALELQNQKPDTTALIVAPAAETRGGAKNLSAEWQQSDFTRPDVQS